MAMGQVTVPRVSCIHVCVCIRIPSGQPAFAGEALIIRASAAHPFVGHALVRTFVASHCVLSVR
jgi:hypothetical protein